MTEPKHTPGPWKWVAIDGGWDGVKQENGSLICKLVLNEPENARLIAAAPELLEALRGLMQGMEHAMPNSGCKGMVFVPRAALDAADSAITKATKG